MSKKSGGIVVLAGLCALSLFLLSCGTSSSRPSGLLYVLTQGSTGIGNNISSYSIDLSSGELSLVNSNASACPTAPTQNNPSPCGPPMDIVLDSTGATAFVLDQGISSAMIAPVIYSFPIGSDGSLGGSTVAATLTTGDTPVSIVRDATGQFLIAITAGYFPPPTVCPLTGSTSAGFAGCPSVSVYTISSGALTLAAGSPFYVSKIPTALSTVTFTPTGSTTSQELLFVTNNQDIYVCSGVCTPHDNTVSVYALSSSGTFQEQILSPYEIDAPNPVSVIAVNTNQSSQTASGGVFVYVGNNGSTGDINPFQVCTTQNPACTLPEVQENLMTPLLQSCSQPPCNPVAPTAAGQNPTAMVLDPTDNFLYSISNGSNQVFGFKVNTTTGTLSAQSPATQPTGSQPVSIALHPSVNNTGQFLFVSNSNSDNVSAFSLNTTSGSMSNPSTVVTPATPSGLAAR